MSLAALGAVAFGALFGSIVSGLAGFAFGLVTLGFWLHAIEPTLAAPLVVSCSLVVQLMNVRALWHAVRWERVLPFVLAGLLGVPIGSYLLGHIDAALFRRILGAFLLIYSGISLFLPPMAPAARAGRLADGAVGLAGGVMGGLSGLSGALPTMWSGLRGWSKDEQRAVYQPFNICMHVATMLTYLKDGFLDRDFAVSFLIALPALGAGGWLGIRLYRRVDEVQFRRIVLWLLLISGGVLLL
ncbi:MAG: sulfite exporter TauE/SafE family protein [Alphaproteobacteria bacterium]|nr:sulfite exporter TauE/SafE family protein [Alphaproteobacteria bacterium]